MLQVELKKILFHQKGLLILLFALLAYAIFCLASGYDSSYAIDRNEDIYLSYLNRWEGKITEQKAQEMETEYAEAVSSDDGKKTAFLTVYNQYYYAKEDTTHRYLMDERGWNTLLTHDGLNFIMLLCLLSFSVPVFCTEYQCGMDQIFRSCRNGRGRLACMKLLTMMALSIGIVFLFQLVQFSVVFLSVGLNGGSYPLQSLSYFADSPYWITIGQAYAIVVLCRCIGAAWFAVLIALLSILFQRAVLTAFAGIAVSALPHLIGSSFIKYILPIPSGMLAGTGYVWGTLTEVGYDENWNLIDIVTFPGIAPKKLCLLLILFLVVISLMFFLAFRNYVGKRRTKLPRTAISAVFIVLLAVSLTGCGGTSNSAVSHDFLADATQGENSVYTVDLDMVENEIYATDKITGESILLTRDLFHDVASISCIYVDEEACYYCTQVDTGSGFQIYRIDLTDFSTKLFYSSGSDNTAMFWGLYEKDLTVDELLADIEPISSFVVDGSHIYYLQCEQLYQVCRFTGRETVAVSNTADMDTLTYQSGEVIYKKQ